MKKTIKSKVKSHKKNNYNYLAYLIGILVIFFGILLFYKPTPTTTPTINQVGVANGKATLTLSPATITMEPNVDQTITLTVDSGDEYTAVSNINLSYDPAILGTPVVTQGDVFTSTLKDTVVADGKINLDYGASIPAAGEKLGAKGSNILATITIRPVAAGTTSINVLDTSSITLMDSTTNQPIESNMLKSANNVNIIVGGGTPASAPSSAEPSTPASITPSSPATPDKTNKPTGLRSNCFDGGNKITLRWDAVTGVTSYKVRMDLLSGSPDISVDNITKTEYEASIKPDQKYSWWVHSSKDGVDSEEAKVNEVVCAKSLSTPTPTPATTQTPKQTIKPTPKPTVKSTPTPTPKVSNTTPTPKPNIEISNPSPLAAGSLNDIFGEDPNRTPSPTADTNIFQKISLGWQAIFMKLAEIFN